MIQPTQKQARNQSMECVKVLAALIILTVHAGAPGKLDRVVDALVRFAVPYFFAVSGFFSGGLDAERIKKRMMRIVRLTMGATALYCVWDCVWAYSCDMSIRQLLWGILNSPQKLMQVIVLQVNPFGEHLWYLSAVLVCYLVLWIYLRLYGTQTVDYQPLYRMGFFLMGVQFLVSTLLMMGGAEIDNLSYRNGWLMGLPFFILGMFLGQYQPVIWERLELSAKKLLFFLVVGVLLSLIEAKAYGKGIDVLVGGVIELVVLMLLLPQYPVVTANKTLSGIISTFGAVSRNIYIGHLLIIQAYDQFFRRKVAGIVGGKWEGWLRLAVVMAVSCLVAVAFERMEYLHKRKKKKVTA